MNLTPRARRRGLIAVMLVALFTITGFLILPPIVRVQAQKRLTAALGRQVTIGKVRLNPYALSATIENVSIMEADGTTKFLGWRKLYVNLDGLSSLFGEWVLSDVTLDGFYARGQVNADRTLNISDLLKKFAATPATGGSKPPRPVRIARLRVTDARLVLSDLSRGQPFATTVGPMTFELTGFRTVSQRGAPYRFSAVTEAGEKLAWSGTLRAEPFQSAGELSIENIDLGKYAPYYADRLQAEIPGGRLSLRAHYDLDLTPHQPVMRLTDGTVALRGFRLRGRGDREDAVDLPAVDLTGVQLDALARTATVASVAVDGGRVRVRREKDGTLNLLAMLTPPAAATAVVPAPTVGGKSAKPPAIKLGEVMVRNFQLAATDLAAPRPVRLALANLRLSLKNVTLAPGAVIPVQLAFNWAPRGTVQVGGTVALTPLQADLKVALAGFDLLPLSPYLEQFVNARLTQGTVTASLAAQARLPAGSAPVASVTGDIAVANLGTVDSVHHEPLAGFEKLTLSGLRASTSPGLSVALKTIDLAHPYARALVNPDKSINLVSVLKTAPAPAAATTPPAPRPRIEIGKVVISDGDFRFTDRSIEPNVNTAITRFGGTIGGLTSSHPAKADVDLKALVDQAGSVAITGKLDPLSARPTVDLKVAVRNVDLLPLSPYSGKYAGYALARGKLLLATNVAVDGPKLDSTNVLTLDHFTFGNAVRSPDATKLPVRLGVALLKGLDGRIVIDVPVQGRTDDPNFRVGRVVLRVIGNLLTKAAVSPFSLLGAAFGGGGEELAFQNFAPGSAALLPGEMKKLETLATALKNRPGLSLGIEGSYDPAADAYALKRIKVAAQVRRAVWEQKHLANPNIPGPDQLVISASENAAMIKQLFNNKFPPGTRFGTPLPPPPAVVAPPPAPAGFFRRLLATLTLAHRRAERRAAEENAKRETEHNQAVAAAVAAGLPLDEMIGRLAEATPVDDNELRALAQARAERVRAYFVEVGKIAPDRIYLANARTTHGTTGSRQGPRVFLTLQ